MPLNWNISKVENWRVKQKSKNNKAVLDILIYATLIIGLGEITQKNYKKFFARLTAYEHLNGAFLYRGKKPYFITLQDVMMWIGLKTNVSNCSATEFEKRITR